MGAGTKSPKRTTKEGAWAKATRSRRGLARGVAVPLAAACALFVLGVVFLGPPAVVLAVLLAIGFCLGYGLLG